MGNYTNLKLLHPKGVEDEIQELSKKRLEKEWIDLFGKTFKTSRGDYIKALKKYAKKHDVLVYVLENSEDFDRFIRVFPNGEVKFTDAICTWVDEEDIIN